jgi:hypothetical protein
MIRRLAVRLFVPVALAAGVWGCAGRAVSPGAAPPRSPSSESQPPNVVAIPEPPAEDAEPEPDDTPTAGRQDARFAGEWLEDWPNRGTCSDRVEVRLSGRGVEVSGADCTDGKAYEYSNARIEGGTLKFTLLVPETNRVLNYALEAVEEGKLVGEVDGGAEATVTWRRP